jgi:DNA-directed RNA polymerase specialized sigma24 family protein
MDPRRAERVERVLRERRELRLHRPVTALEEAARAAVRLRVADGASLAGVARQLGVPQSSLHNWLYGRRGVSRDRLEHLVVMLGVAA